MTTALVPNETFDYRAFLAECKERYATFTEEQRLDELASCAVQTIKNAVRIASLIWATKQAKGDLEPYRRMFNVMFQFYLSIGKGELSINLVRVLGFDPKYVLKLRRLDIAEQDRLCKEPVPVVEPAPDGTLTHRMYRADEIIDAGLDKQVFSDEGTVRTVPEQEAWIKRQQRRERPYKPPEQVGGYRIDYEDSSVIIGNKRVALPVLEEIVKLLRRHGHFASRSAV